MQTNPYQRYAETNLLSNNPLELVVALYRGALDSVIAACRFNEGQDHFGRGRAVNKALDILMELTLSLDMSAGGTLAVQLRDLYAYMRLRLGEAHVETSQAKLIEVAALLSTLLDGWQQIAAANGSDAGYGFESAPVSAVVASGGLAAGLAYARA